MKSKSESRSVVSEYWSGQPFPSPGHLSNTGIEPRSPTLQVDSLPAEPPGKPKNTGVGSRSLLRGIFLIQELNRGLLHCRQILYQLSYQGRLEMKTGIILARKHRTSNRHGNKKQHCVHVFIQQTLVSPTVNVSTGLSLPLRVLELHRAEYSHWVFSAT